MGAARGKSGLASISGVLCNSYGVALALFSRRVGCMESNEAEVVSILEALSAVCFFLHFFVDCGDWRVIPPTSSLGCLLGLHPHGDPSFFSMRLRRCRHQFLWS